jgi:drug/metabolite transporter (DMT)-like permease
LDTFTILLMLLAGLMHATWHSVVKGSTDQRINLAGMGLVAAVPCVFVLPFLQLPSGGVWIVLAASTILHVIYKVFVSAAYRIGDFGEAFPLARGFVPLVAALIAFIALDQMPRPFQVFGILLICAGLVLIATSRLRHALGGPLLAASFGAGLMVAGYAVLDSFGAKLSGDWASFTAWLVVFDSAIYLLVVRATLGPATWRKLAAMRWRVLVSGALGLASFSIFLWALSRNPVGLVSALRETSILFAILIAAMRHSEPLTVSRLTAGGLIIGGIVVIAM